MTPTPLKRAALWAAAGIVALAFLSLYTVNQTEEALVVRLGKPVRAVHSPGLHWKMPLIDSVVYYDARLLHLEPPLEQVILGDQKRLLVQVYARYRITDPLLYYQSVQTIAQGQAQLSQIISSATRRSLGQVPLTSLLTPDRVRATKAILTESAARSLALGVTVTDVRLRRADLPPETSQAIYDRMKSERNRMAKELRAQGIQWQQEIEAKADRERTVILSEAQKQALAIHGDADAQATRIYAQAYGKDPAFYKFYRALRTYQGSLADSTPTLMLSPNSDLLRFFDKGSAGAAARDRKSRAAAQ